MAVGYQGSRDAVIARDGDWAKDAACIGFPKELFHGTPWERDRERKQREYRAKQICETCPVRSQCLNEALRNGEYGIWGGTTEAERKKLLGRHRRRMR